MVIQAEMSGPIPAEVPLEGLQRKRQDVDIPHCQYIPAFLTRTPKSHGS